MDKETIKTLLRKLPSIERVLSTSYMKNLLEKYPRKIILDSLRKHIGNFRESVINSEKSSIQDDFLERISFLVEKDMEKWNRHGLKRAINATGVVIHTNLGRVPLGLRARERINSILKSYCSLEIDVDSGKRGKRHKRIEDLIIKITGAEAATVVNNASAAILLVLQTLAREKEVIVSRGELVEIGGGFRIPEVMKRSGCHLVEVGTTNKTRIDDYRKAVTENTGMMLKVHRSNFKIIGFTESASIEELVLLAKEKKVPLFYDQGNGLMLDLRKFDIFHDEDNVLEAVSAGVDIVAFSGDKLLGGPQAGIILGKKKYLDILKKDDLLRALRVDKLVLGALEATLEEYLEEKSEIPVIQMLTLSQKEIKKRASDFVSSLPAFEKAEINISEGLSEIGGGTFPGYSLPTYTICIKYSKGARHLQEKLRKQVPSIYSRIIEDVVILDLRTVLPLEIRDLYNGLEKALK